MMKQLFRFLAPAVLLAVFGFSFSLATSPTPSPRSRPGPRATGFIGTALRFTTPFTVGSGDPAFNTDAGGAVSADPQGFDLGDVLLGSQTVRYITAAGGYMPYTFIARPNFDFLPNGQTPPLPHLSRLGVFNELIGTYNPNAIVNPMSNLLGAYRFDVTLDDVIGTGRVGTFRLNVFGAAGERFRFAHNKLPAAQLGNPYIASLNTLNGLSPVRYSINGSITADTTYSTLEEIGLTLTPSGILYGRPLKNSSGGTISFTARATDFNGALALSRDNSVVDQKFTITVENNTAAMTELTAFDASLKINQAVSDTDRFVYSGLVDLRGDTLPALAGAVFTLRLGTAQFSGAFDEAGRVRGLSSDGSLLAVTLGTTGTIKIDLQNATLADALGATSLSGNVDNFTVIVGMEFRTFRSSDVVNLRGRERADKLALTYSYRRDARPNSNTNGNGSPAGAFQIISVAGIDGVFNEELNDQVPGDPGDTWLVRFVGIPRYAIDAGADSALPDKTSSSGSINAKIEIGADFTQDVSAPKAGPRFRFKADKLHDAGVLDLAIDPVNYVHRLKTAVLPDFDTGIPTALSTKDPNVFTLRMSINGFIGETGRIIVPNRTRWDMR